VNGLTLLVERKATTAAYAYGSPVDLELYLKARAQAFRWRRVRRDRAIADEEHLPESYAADSEPVVGPSGEGSNVVRAITRS
jgi:hypothetical protein